MKVNDRRYKQAAEVVQSFLAINSAIGKLVQRNAASLGLTLHQMAIVNTLAPVPNLTLKELAERLTTAKSTVSVNVDELVQAGLIVRVTSEQDRREIKLSLSEAGREKSRQSTENAYSYRAMDAVLTRMSADEVARVLDTNRQILAELENHEDFLHHS
ncbi:MarR family winged helix-turn-helix transcriptional regulator [Paenibacillus thalictri]|uniref:MarR family transcriptional regulator n=1 Tax=Paenibacillus thalictri TaxID=2527873 RepID=A0A4V2J3I8_9BACL|nr:MarR family transcriptional regulator [Paenibacillus thalictri]TBL72701.1 MarR family transcriptional regulator [Paenibacillus thalictri]